MVWCPSWCTPGLCSQPASIYHCHGSTISPFLDWLSLGAPLCWWPCNHCRNIKWIVGKVSVWKANLESKGLHVNVGKTNILVSAHNAPKPVDGNKFSCGMCNKGFGINSIKCHVCGFWVHKRCSNIKGPLKPDPDFKCKKCRGEVSNVTIPDIESVVISGEENEKVSSFCYLGDFIGQCGGCFDATATRIRSA